MRFVFRKLIWIAGGLLVLAVIAVVVVLGALDRVVHVGIEKVGPLVTRVPLQVEDVDISLLGGSFAMHGFKMGNPPEFAAPRAAYAGTVLVECELGSLLREEVILHRVEVEKPEITVELSGGRTNLGTILEGIRMPERKSKKFRIGLLRITEPAVELAGLPAGQTARLNLPDIEMENLSAGGEPLSPAELAALILQRLQEEILGRAGGQLPDESLRALRDDFEEALQEGSRVLEEARRGLEDQAGDLLEGLKLPGQ